MSGTTGPEPMPRAFPTRVLCAALLCPPAGVHAAPAAPQLDWMTTNYALNEVDPSATPYADLLTIREQIEVPVSWAKASGDDTTVARVVDSARKMFQPTPMTVKTVALPVQLAMPRPSAQRVGPTLARIERFGGLSRLTLPEPTPWTSSMSAIGDITNL